MPNEVNFDNGKDYRSKSFSKDYPMSLVNQLGIGQIYATPYQGQAKTVERFFGTLTNRFSRRFDTYTGCNAKIRPECMKISNKEIVAQAPTLDEFVKLLSAYIAEYNQTANGGMDMDGKCPDQVYAENLAVKQVVSDLDSLRLLCGNSEERVVHKNGISIKNNNYYNDALLYRGNESYVPGLSESCIGYLLKLAHGESLRTAKKLYNVATEFAAAQGSALTVKHLRDTHRQLLGKVCA